VDVETLSGEPSELIAGQHTIPRSSSPDAGPQLELGLGAKATAYRQRVDRSKTPLVPRMPLNGASCRS
jgi:hypothetical protein